MRWTPMAPTCDLTRSPAADYAPAWSPDGERIACVEIVRAIWTSGPWPSTAATCAASPMTRRPTSRRPGRPMARCWPGSRIATAIWRSMPLASMAASCAISAGRLCRRSRRHLVALGRWHRLLYQPLQRLGHHDAGPRDGPARQHHQSDDLEQAPHWGLKRPSPTTGAGDDGSERADKPNSVPRGVAVIWDGDCSPPAATYRRLGRATLYARTWRRAHIWSCSRWGCRAGPVACAAGGLLHHPFTLTALMGGGLLSVALSVGSPRLDVIQHRAL